MINFFDKSVKNNLITYDNIQKIATGQADDYTTGCLLDYNYFNSYYKMIGIDLSKQQAPDANSKSDAANQIYCKFSSRKNTIMFFFIEEVKETILDFSQGTVKVL